MHRGIKERQEDISAAAWPDLTENNKFFLGCTAILVSQRNSAKPIAWPVLFLVVSSDLYCPLLRICWRHCSVLVPIVTAFPDFPLQLTHCSGSQRLLLLWGFCLLPLSWTFFCFSWNLCTPVLGQFPRTQSLRWTFGWFTKELPSGEMGKGVRGQGKGRSPRVQLEKKKKRPECREVWR